MDRENALVRTELLVHGEEVARRRLRGRRQLAARAQALVEVVRRQVDAVAVALGAEVDVERNDTPVREVLARVGEIRRRVEDDRRVLGREVHEAACSIAATISSSSWSFVRQAAAPAS